MLTKKAHDFIVTQQQQGNENLLTVLERDARAVQVMLADLMRHQQGHVHTDEELNTIETSLKQYESRIDEDIVSIKKQIGQHHEDTTTYVPVTDHFTTENPTTFDGTTTEIHDYTTGEQNHHYLPTPPTPNDNLETAAEDLVVFTDHFLTLYDGHLKQDIVQQVKVVRDLLAIAKDPSNSSDKFLTAVVLGNQMKILRELLYKAAATV